MCLVYVFLIFFFFFFLFHQNNDISKDSEEGQKAKFDPKTNEIKWELARFAGVKEHTLRAKLTLTKVRQC